MIHKYPISQINLVSFVEDWFSCIFCSILGFDKKIKQQYLIIAGTLDACISIRVYYKKCDSEPQADFWEEKTLQCLKFCEFKKIGKQILKANSS